jgi:hypothetical protein
MSGEKISAFDYYANFFCYSLTTNNNNNNNNKTYSVCGACDIVVVSVTQTVLTSQLNTQKNAQCFVGKYIILQLIAHTFIYTFDLSRKLFFFF